MADLWVTNSQHWLNTRYAKVTGFSKVTEDGVTGWATMYAITRGLQHELGITSLSDNFGDGTASAFSSKIGTISSTTKNAGLIGLLQCALWCKGYAAGTAFGKWTNTVGSSVATIRSRLGLSTSTSVDVKLMRSLLTLDSYDLTADGRATVRSAQQWLNGRYASHTGFRLVPCDGVYSRDVQFGFMLGIQYEVGISDSAANGNFGPGTQSGLKSQANVAGGSADGTKKFVSILQIALIFNGYSLSRTGKFDAATTSTLQGFQGFMLIPVSGRADYETWAALLISTGNPDRPVKGVDTSTRVDAAFAAQLRSQGYEVIGRYLTVEPKSIGRGELETLFAAGFSVFPIMQNYNNAPQYFTEDIGYTQGFQAAMRARQLGFTAGTVIFFPVDYDAYGTEIDTTLSVYFRAVRRGLDLSVTARYRIGVYATRNVAERIHTGGLADAVWVSGMSSGFSGNLGYPMPSGWWYNQIQEIKSINIDRNAVSPDAEPVSIGAVSPGPSHSEAAWNAHFEMARLLVLAERALNRQPTLAVSASSEAVMWYLQTGRYDSGFWILYTPLPETSSSAAVNEVWARARLELQDDAGPIAESIKKFPGKVQHMIATAHGVLLYPDGAGERAITAADIGGWSGDLVTFWTTYRQPGNSGKSVTEFAADYLGGKAGAGFQYDDLIADAEGWLLGRRMGQGATISEAYRALHRTLQTDAAILRQFLNERFSMHSPEAADLLKQCIQETFTGAWPWSAWPRDHFLDGAAVPSATELTELQTAAVKKWSAIAWPAS
jgi:peptidoglycan hydrolase-like protein with peptidoglycan-binding domain